MIAGYIDYVVIPQNLIYNFISILNYYYIPYQKYDDIKSICIYKYTETRYDVIISYKNNNTDEYDIVVNSNAFLKHLKIYYNELKGMQSNKSQYDTKSVPKIDTTTEYNSSNVEEVHSCIYKDFYKQYGDNLIFDMKKYNAFIKDKTKYIDYTSQANNQLNLIYQFESINNDIVRLYTKQSEYPLADKHSYVLIINNVEFKVPEYVKHCIHPDRIIGNGNKIYFGDIYLDLNTFEYKCNLKSKLFNLLFFKLGFKL